MVSGWHDFGNVNLVHAFKRRTTDVNCRRHLVVYQAATSTGPTTGNGRADTFGHAGGIGRWIVGDTIVYCDGVAIEPHKNRPRDFVASPECFLGIIDEKESRRIDWREIEPHPGKPRYRMAAAGTTEEAGVIFIGGSENPYNYDGMGYNGAASSPAEDALLFQVETGSWQQIDIKGAATMDHRGLVFFEGDWVTIGGMLGGQEVTDDVVSYSLD